MRVIMQGLMKLSAGILAVGFAALVCASPASAAIVTVTYTGEVFGSDDLTGMFGPPGPDHFNGSGYVATYVFNTDLGSLISGTVNGITMQGYELVPVV